MQLRAMISSINRLRGFPVRKMISSKHKIIILLWCGFINVLMSAGRVGYRLKIESLYTEDVSTNRLK
jgi:hypothetical protein